MANNVKGKAFTVAFTTSASAKNKVALPKGWYNLTADQDCYIETGDSSVVAAAPTTGSAADVEETGSWPLWGRGYGADVYIDDGHIAVKGISESGTLWIKGGQK